MNAQKTIARAISLRKNPTRACAYVVRLERMAKIRGNLAGLRAQIESEVSPILAASRAAEIALFGSDGSMGRPVGSDACQMEPDAMQKYSHEYTMAGAGAVPSGLASANDSFHSMRAASMDNAGEQTRSEAGGAHAQE